MEQPGTEIAIRLWSHQGACMVAHDDKETVGESDDGSSPNAKWVVERVRGNPKVIRLKSCFGLYLTAYDGKVDWEPICDDGVHVKLKSWGGKLLQTDGAAQNWTMNLMRWVGELLQGCCQPSQHEPTPTWVFWDVEDDWSDESSSSASEPNFEVSNNMLAPLLQLNPMDARALYGGWAEVSSDSGQPNGPIRLDAEEPWAAQVAYGSGQRNRSVANESWAHRSQDTGQRNSPPRR